MSLKKTKLQKNAKKTKRLTLLKDLSRLWDKVRRVKMTHSLSEAESLLPKRLAKTLTHAIVNRRPNMCLAGKTILEVGLEAEAESPEADLTIGIQYLKRAVKFAEGDNNFHTKKPV